LNFCRHANTDSYCLLADLEEVLQEKKEWKLKMIIMTLFNHSFVALGRSSPGKKKWKI
jgi:hypothetical protein